jgi:hypothetical protein
MGEQSVRSFDTSFRFSVDIIDPGKESMRHRSP